MNKIEYKEYDETLYEDVCDNGLKIMVYHKPLFKTTACLFGTPFGSFGAKERNSEGTIFNFEKGIAHFLEHKLFESDHGDVLSEFSELGANVNAFTSYQETVYYFSTTSEEISIPLNLLLDFVQDLHISEESVEKEKGIIIQELMMYLQNPDSRIYFETFKGMYHNYPLKDDIGGTDESVSKITKKDLEACYNLNYHPSNMLVVVVTPSDPLEIINIIKNNQNKKSFAPLKPVEVIFDDEPNSVVENYKEIIMDISEIRSVIGFKFPYVVLDDKKRVKNDWMVNIALEAYFSPLNPDYQTWIDNKKITAFFSYEEDFGRGHSYILFSDNTDDPLEFKEFILKELEKFKKIMIKKETLNLIKNRNLGQLMRIFNKPENMMTSFFRDNYNKVSLFENLRIVKSIDEKECFELIKNLDFSNYCLTVLKRE